MTKCHELDYLERTWRERKYKNLLNDEPEYIKQHRLTCPTCNPREFDEYIPQTTCVLHDTFECDLCLEAEARMRQEQIA